MPCNSDYMEPVSYEIELSRVACLLDELDGKKTINKSHWEGYHPKVYNNQRLDGDKLVALLCKRLQNINVSKQSLEMQIWWRDHQLADKKRLEKELKAKKNQADKEKALKKLTPYERKLLGLGD